MANDLQFKIEQAHLEYLAHVELLCAAAFRYGFRLAVSPAKPMTATSMTGMHFAAMDYDYMMIGPGEKAPKSWTIYEERNGIAVGRSA